MTSWKMPATSWNTTTIAGALWKPTASVPVPWPPVAASQTLHVISVTVVPFVAHPTVIVAGRTCGVGPGPQDRTAGTGAAVVEVAYGGRRRRCTRRGGRGIGGGGIVRWGSLGTDAQSNGGSDTQGRQNEHDDTSADDRTSAYRDECRVVLRHYDPRYFATLRKRRMPTPRVCKIPRSPQPQEWTLHGTFLPWRGGHSARTGSR